MRIRFIEVPIGRDYKVGQVVEFNGAVEQTYARKFITRGWAVDVADDPEPASVPPKETKATPSAPAGFAAKGPVKEK